ncbi:MAG: AEC family transporter [Acetatifactor sp.]|nr:AEC family transporter [Acetatifactor sp.]
MGTTELISLQLRMFLIMSIGLLFRKKNWISGEGKKNLTDLVIYLILPCNIVKSFMIEFDENTLQNFGVVFLVSVLIQVVCAVFAKLFYDRMMPEHRKVLQYATVASNAGFLGNPVAEGVFGSMGLALASVYLIPQRIIMWSAGVSYFTEGTDRKSVFKRVITHPCIIAVAVGLIFMLTQVKLPSFLDSALKDIGNCNTAMSMLVIGTILADVKPKDMLERSIFLFSGLRLLLIPLLVYGGCVLLHIDSLVTGVSVLLAAMPAASTTAILAAKYEGDAAYASKCVVTTTVLSLLTTPVWSIVLLRAIR